MSSVGIKELKDRLTQYLHHMEQGEEIVITKRGKPIGMLQAIQAVKKTSSVEVRLAQLALRGLVTLPTRKPSRKIQNVKATGTSMSQTILEDRR